MNPIKGSFLLILLFLSPLNLILSLTLQILTPPEIYALVGLPRAFLWPQATSSAECSQLLEFEPLLFISVRSSYADSSCFSSLVVEGGFDRFPIKHQFLFKLIVQTFSGSLMSNSISWRNLKRHNTKSKLQTHHLEVKK